ncbi:MAG: phosphoribosylformylglycinamidine synthase subunit PurS [Alphaproteobacteria bacterium]|nr:phosphoribosylformylglycinamidine synthase subunit PurS [Alphaproteobacteria bacterium]
MKATVHIMLKKGVLDPQGKAIGHALENLGFEDVGDVRQGKVIEIEVGASTTKAQIEDMCDKLLANPVIEDYRVTLEEIA